jgi:large subunit ribosomal protein L25
MQPPTVEEVDEDADEVDADEVPATEQSDKANESKDGEE